MGLWPNTCRRIIRKENEGNVREKKTMKTKQRKIKRKTRNIKMPYQSTASYKGLNYFCSLGNRAIKFRTETRSIPFNCLREKHMLVHKLKNITCNFPVFESLKLSGM